MDGKSLTYEYIDNIKEDESLYYEDYKKAKDKVAKSNAKYKGKAVPFLYQPMFFTEEDIDSFNRIGKLVMSIGNKVTKRYIECEEYRKMFKYSKLLEELILVDPGYDVNIPISRFDMFYDGRDSFKFIEINTDGSSGMNEDNIFSRIMLEAKSMEPMKEKHGIEYFELIDSWVEESLNIYDGFKNKLDKPNIGIVDFTETGITAEFETFKDAYIKKGYNTEIIDPRDLKYIDGKLFYEDMRIDLIYRRIVTVEFIEKAEEIPDLVRAYKDGAVCMIGSIRSQIMHNKIIFKVLHHNETLAFLTEEEKTFIKAHIPYTGEFAGDRFFFQQVKEDKDRYIIKPMDSFASQGVSAGIDFSQIEWEKVIKKCWNKDYLFQEFMEPSTRPFIQFDEKGNLDTQDFNMNIGVYMYDGKFKGVYTRISRQNIIFGREGYYSIPNLLVTD